MIERATTCLESGGRCLLHLPKPPFRNRRALHSAFWSHGAGDIALPSWWIALLQVSSSGERSWYSKGAKETKNTSVSEPHAIGLLDFLYPLQTLAIIRQYVDRNATALRRHRPTPANLQRPRSFTSAAESQRLDLPEDDPCLANTTILRPPLEAVDASLPSPTSAEKLHTKVHNVLNLQNIPKRNQELWQTFREMQDLSSSLLPTISKQILKCLATSSSRTDLERARLVFDSMSVSTPAKEDYTHAITACLAMNDLDGALAIYYRTDNLQQKHGSSLIFQHTIQHERWDVAPKIWQDRRSHQQSHHSAPRAWWGVNLVPLNELMGKAASYIDHATETTEAIGTGDAALLREFAVDLVRRVLSFRRQEYESRAQRTMLRKLRYLTEPDYQIRKASIMQNLSLGVAKRDHSRYALRIYRVIRQDPSMILDTELLFCVLKTILTIRSSVGPYEVLEDYRKYHRSPTTSAYKLLIIALARHGDLDTVTALFNESLSRFHASELRQIANSVLFACFRRADVRQLDMALQKLKEIFGFAPDQDAQNIMIATHARVGNHDTAVQLFQNMEANTATYNTMMGMFAKRGELDAVIKLYEQSMLEGVKTGFGMFESLVLAHLKDGQTNKAHQLVEEALSMDLEDSKFPLQPHATDSPRTRMWNTLLFHYAAQGGLAKIGEITKRMTDVGVALDNISYAAIMKGFCTKNLPFAALKVLTRVMPEAGLRATPLHYALVMSAFLAAKLYDRVMELSQRMVRKNMRSTFATQQVVLKAAAKIDVEEHRATKGENESVSLARAEDILERTLDTMDPMELAPVLPNMFAGTMTPDVAFVSAYFPPLIAIYGKNKAFDKAQEMYDKLIATANKFERPIESSPPVEVLSALMESHYNAGDHKEVERCWFLAWEKSKTLARRQEADISKPDWVLFAHRTILNQPLTHYLKSLGAQSRIADAKEVLENVTCSGFQLTNVNWNTYIQVLAQNDHEVEAFAVCERELIRGWPGWETLGRGHRRNLKRRLFHALPKGFEPNRRMPMYATLVHLAAAYIGAQSVGFETGKTMMRSFIKVAPKTVDVVVKMPKIGDKLQSRLLRRN